MLFRSLARAERLPGISMAPELPASFVPVRIEEPGMPVTPGLEGPASHANGEQRPPMARQRRAGLIEVGLGNGRSLKADEGIDPVVLARLAAALDRSIP